MAAGLGKALAQVLARNTGKNMGTAAAAAKAQGRGLKQKAATSKAVENVRQGGIIEAQEAKEEITNKSNLLVPFDNKVHTPQDMGLGGKSTEYLITLDSPEGGVWVIPSIWWNNEGKPKLVSDPEEAFELAEKYEKETGLEFPRFKKGAYKQADKFAKERSEAGGATQGPLARDVKLEKKAQVAKTFTDAL